ncbi:MAG: Lipid-A-disaccharide synthase [Pseudomonadota bacterium]|jgi:lipid-A-disaccharide synthase-like uncharacterized protein
MAAALNAPEWLVLAVGFGGQALFSGRFLVQWLASERARRSVVPVAFWHLSVAGGLALFVYAVYRGDPVFMLGQGLGLLVYLRNLWLIARAPPGTLPPADGRQG